MSTITLDGTLTPAVIPANAIQNVELGDELLLLGTIANAGTVFVNGDTQINGAPTSMAQIAAVLLDTQVVTLISSGTLDLNGSDAVVAGAIAGTPTLISAGNTIEGWGDLGFSSAATVDATHTLYPIDLVNLAGGVIDATGPNSFQVIGTTFVPPQSLLLQSGNDIIVNSGLIEGTEPGGLLMLAGTIDQAGGGEILATGSGAAIFEGNQAGTVDIIGGTLATEGDGVIAIDGFSYTALDGRITPVTIEAGTTIGVDIADPTTLLGTIENEGTLLAENGGTVTQGYFVLATPTVALTGGGLLINPIMTGQSDAPATLVLGDTIVGVGQIGIATIDDTIYGTLGASAPVALQVLSGGEIDATGTSANEGGGGYVMGDAIYLYGGGAISTNSGLLEATGIGGLDIEDMTIDQTGGGTLLADGAGVDVYLQGVTVIGGSVLGLNGGIINFNGGTNALVSAAPLMIAPSAVIYVTGFISPGTLLLQASTIDNLGTLGIVTGGQIDAGTLVLSSPTTTLTGAGTVALSGEILAPAATTLINTDNTIGVPGGIGGGISGTQLAIVNDAAGIIDGEGVDAGGGITNAGLLENVSVGFGTTTNIDNIGGGRLLADGNGAGLYSGTIAGGTLDGVNGGSYQIGSVYQATGGGVVLDGRQSPVTITAGATLNDVFHTFDASFTFDNAGGLSLLGTIDLFGTVIGANPDAASGLAAISTAGLLQGNGTVAGYLNNTGTVLAQGGTLTVTGDVSDTGEIALDTGAAFHLGGATGETVNFGRAGNERLILDQPTLFTGTLANLGYGDIIDLGTLAIQSATPVGNTLTVTLTDNSTLTYALSNLPVGANFVPEFSPFSPNTSELIVRCFAAGTRIATPEGEQPVETLRIGDIVLTARGEPYPIEWIGRRHIDLQRHPAPDRARPVRIAAGAFGPGSPHTDLMLSPDHAVHINDVLIPVRYLINDRSITQIDVDDVTYFHVELSSHQLLLAEGLAVESYLDAGDRSVFEHGGAVIDLYPDFYAMQWEARGYAPLIVTGPELERARQKVARFAARAVRAQKRRTRTGSTSHGERAASASATSRVTPISASIWSDNSGNA